ncbi:23S rRNA (guanosine(2251)-2'-O)-methyltransferase RlmB [bacterium]|nr:23S rRNA (guanosine(2251)-2'-O)-methyltransferase RlmB [bacterium]
MDNYVFGRNNVWELLKDGSREVNKIILMKGMRENPKISEIIDMAKRRSIVFQFLPKEKFMQYSEYTHQGVVAFVAPIEYVDLETFLDKKKQYKKVIITDGVEDPHNFGSIIRTAVCAGYDAVIFPSRRNAQVNSTVEKSSQGAVNHIDMIMVNSLAATIDKLKNNDFWIIATDIDAKDNYYEINYCDMNFAIVMGSEKDGISSTVLKQADFRVKIPILNNFDSLNVANAASIVIYESVKQTVQKSSDSV